MGASQSAPAAEVEAWERVCAAMSFEEAQAEREYDREQRCLALFTYCAQQGVGLVGELPCRCGYHWLCAAGWAGCSCCFACCGPSLPVRLLKHHHNTLGLCACAPLHIFSDAAYHTACYTSSLMHSKRRAPPLFRYNRIGSFLIANIKEPDTPWCVLPMHLCRPSFPQLSTHLLGML